MSGRLGVLVGIALAFAYAHGAAPPTHLTADSDFLTDVQIREYHDAALKGDASAALKLSSYYEYFESDIIDADFWLRLAAELGDCKALGDFANTVKHEPYLGGPKHTAAWKERFERTCSPHAPTSK